MSDKHRTAGQILLSTGVIGFLALAACETKNAGPPAQSGGATGSGGQQSSGGEGGGGASGSGGTRSSAGAGGSAGATTSGGAGGVGGATGGGGTGSGGATSGGAGGRASSRTGGAGAGGTSGPVGGSAAGGRTGGTTSSGGTAAGGTSTQPGSGGTTSPGSGGQTGSGGSTVTCTDPPPTSSGVTVDAAGVAFTVGSGKMKVYVCRDDILRVQYTSTSTLPKKDSLSISNKWTTPTPFCASESGGNVIVTTARMKAKVNLSTGLVSYTDLADKAIVAETKKATTAATVQGTSTFKI
ncbi:MAG: DUF4968 domain-containing protein, partial [Deltaproteobacteria bacterium]|nr:DUF4968 domain-containing protein [Deltaproteobacteria bacterium]